MDLPQRRHYAATGYCPWISGSGRVYAWVPESLADNPDASELTLLADMGGLSYPAIDAIIRCCQAVEARGGRLPPDDTPEGQVRHRLFQEQIFVDVFGVRDPEFTDYDPKALAPTAIVVKRFWPRARDRAQVYFGIAKAAAVLRGVRPGAIDPDDRQARAVAKAARKAASAVRGAGEPKGEPKSEPKGEPKGKGKAPEAEASQGSEGEGKHGKAKGKGKPGGGKPKGARAAAAAAAMPWVPRAQAQSEMCVPRAPIPRNIKGLTTTVMADPELMLLLGALISILSIFLVFLMLGLGFACYNLWGRHVSAARGAGRRSSPPQGISAVRGADTSETEARPPKESDPPTQVRTIVLVVTTEHPRVVYITPGGLCYHIHRQCAGLRNVSREPAHRRACTICCSIPDDPPAGMDTDPTAPRLS